ncbi:MAG: hypothetical protein HYW47_03565 [Deltaproteobacteria bacterium]|nr:hypothetical protein [Deltaproteobacteria bacterium]
MRRSFYMMLSSILFGVMAAAHLLRYVMKWEVIFRGHVAPMWPSLVIFVVLGFLGYQIFKLR